MGSISKGRYPSLQTPQVVISMITLAGLIWYKSKGYGGPTVIWSLKAVSQYGRHTLIREGKARTVEGS